MTDSRRLNFMPLTLLVKRQYRYFQELPTDQKRLLFATFLYTFASPMLFLFSMTYLWRQSQNPIVLALYFIGYYVGLAIGFLINSFLLRRLSPKFLYSLGCVMAGTVPILLVSLGTASDNLSLYLGLLLGTSSGMYWANRNYLTSELTVNSRRFKYISLEWVLMISAGILSPLVIGWLIVLGERGGWYEAETAYRTLAFLALPILFCAGFLVTRITRIIESPRHLLVKKPSRTWNTMRCLDAMNGFVQGFEAVIPVVILFSFMKSEDAIGTVQSAAAVLSALSIYALGKREDHDHSVILAFWSFLTFIGRLIFAVLNSILSMLLFYSTESFGSAFRWASLTTVMYEAVDHEQPKDEATRRYAYLMDREFFLNLGRVPALLLFIAAYSAWPEASIRYGLLFLIFVQVSMVLVTKRLTKLTRHTV